MDSESVGDIKAQFKPGIENLLAGVIIGLLIIGAGIACIYFPTTAAMELGGKLPIWREKGWCWLAVGLMYLLGVSLIVGGTTLLIWIRHLRSFRISVGEHGFSVSDRKLTRVITWDEITSVEETHLYERPPLLKGVAKYALPKMKSISFVVNTTTGAPIRFDGNTIKGHTGLAELIKTETQQLSIPWNIVEVQSN